MSRFRTERGKYPKQETQHDTDLPTRIENDTAREWISNELEVFRADGLQISCELPYRELTDVEISLLRDLFPFCRKLSEEFRDTLESAMSDSEKQTRPISEKMAAYLHDHKLTVPRLHVSVGEIGAKKIESHFGKQAAAAASSSPTVLTFTLPKQLEQFWWKGINEYTFDEKASDIKGTAVEWGRHYRDILPTVWSHTQGLSDTLAFHRLNEHGHHEKNKFYYCWEARRTSDDTRSPFVTKPSTDIPLASW